MNKSGYVIAKNKGVTEFFTSASSFDRPKWVSLEESKVYASVELAEAAAKKLYKYGAYEARIVSMVEAMAFEMPDEQDDDQHAAQLPSEDDDSTEMVAIVRGEDGVDIPQGDESIDVEARVDQDLGIADEVDQKAIQATVDAELDPSDDQALLDDDEDIDELNGDQVAGGPDGAPITRMESVIVNELSVKTLRSYADKAQEQLLNLNRARRAAGKTELTPAEFNKRANRIKAVMKASDDADDREEIEHSIARGREDHPRPGYMREQHLSELAKTTLGSYASKASRSVAELRGRSERGDSDASLKRQMRRRAAARAMEKMRSASLGEAADIKANQARRKVLAAQLNKLGHELDKATADSDRNHYNKLVDQWKSLRQEYWDLKDAVTESDTMPSRPMSDAQPSENKTIATDMKPTPVIKYSSRATDNDADDTKMDKSGAWPHDAKVKTPEGVLADLRSAIEDHKKSAKAAERSNTERASFCLTVVNAFEQLLADLELGTAEGIKAAQVHMTSWMNPITAYLPTSVQQYVYLGGRKPSLKDFFAKAKMSESAMPMDKKMERAKLLNKRAELRDKLKQAREEGDKSKIDEIETKLGRLSDQLDDMSGE